MYESLVVTNILIFMYLLIGWIHVVILFILRTYKNQNFSELSEELRNTENKISFSRQFYNDTVTMYNTKLEVFPSNIIAGIFNFKSRDLFEAESADARKNVKVDFGK